MKPFIRIIVVFAIVLFYTACQKEVSGVVSTNTPLQDSTTTGTDSTITNHPDSLTIRSFSPDSGGIGTVLTITGTGFGATPASNQVAINGTPAVLISATNLTLVVQVQAGTTTGKISIIVNGKTVKSIADFIVVKDSIVSATNVWVRKADVPSDTYTFNSSFSINGVGYIFNGNGLRAYDPIRNTWSQKKSLPAGVSHRYGFYFVIGNKVYVGLGASYPGENIRDSTTNYKEVWVYDPMQDQWTQKNDFPGAARVMPFSFAVNGFGYMGGGDPTNANFGYLNDFWKYDPASDTWIREKNFPAPGPIGFTGFSLADAGFVLGAGAGNPTAPISNNAEVPLWKYVPETNEWEQKQDFPTEGREIVSAVVFTIFNYAYAAIGALDATGINAAATDDFWKYDPASDAWTKKADVGGGGRWLGTGFSIGGKGYMGLGTGNTADNTKDDFWEYTPD